MTELKNIDAAKEAEKKEVINRALKKAKNIDEAAQMLGISRATLYRFIQKFKLQGN